MILLFDVELIYFDAHIVVGYRGRKNFWFTNTCGKNYLVIYFGYYLMRD